MIKAFAKNGDYNTPSGCLRYALDFFVYHYVQKGYDWTAKNDDFIFFKPNGKLYAKAKYDNRHYIIGYDIYPVE